jgi:hypothetical protein
MTTVKQYVNTLTSKEANLCLNYLGVDVAHAGSVELRAINLLHKVWLGGLMKALVDKGVLTDAQIDTAINSTLGDGWPAVPLEPPPTG